MGLNFDIGNLGNFAHEYPRVFFCPIDFNDLSISSHRFAIGLDRNTSQDNLKFGGTSQDVKDLDLLFIQKKVLGNRLGLKVLQPYSFHRFLRNLMSTHGSSQEVIATKMEGCRFLLPHLWVHTSQHGLSTKHGRSLFTQGAKMHATFLMESLAGEDVSDKHQLRLENFYKVLVVAFRFLRAWWFHKMSCPVDIDILDYSQIGLLWSLTWTSKWRTCGVWSDT